MAAILDQNQNDFSYCWSISHLDTSNELWVHCPFGSGEKVQNRFSKWTPWPQFGISYRNDLSYFFIYKSPLCVLPSFESTGLSVQKKKGKIDFQDGHHLGFPIGTISAISISTSHLDAFYQFSNQLALWFREISKKKKSFKMVAMVAILDFPS